MSDFFDLFDLPRAVNLDADALQRAFHERSRKYHPDLHQNALPRVQRQMLRSSMALNEAYRTLRDGRSRLEYLLSLESPNRAERRSARVPMAFFDAVEQVQELLFDYRAAFDAERPAIAEKLRALREDAGAVADGLWSAVASVGGEWDANERAHNFAEIAEDAYQSRKAPLLERLERLRDELAYADRVVANIDRALDGERDTRVPPDSSQEP